MDNDRQLKNNIKKHLSKLGFKFGLTPEKIGTLLKKIISSSRYEEFMEIDYLVSTGEKPINDLYKFLETSEEANLVFSQQSDCLLENTAWICKSIKNLSLIPSKICDLGCASGPLTSYISSEYESAKVVGVDREKHFIDFATSSINKSNASFLSWDYMEPKHKDFGNFDVLVSSFGIELLYSYEQLIHPLENSNIRNLEIYKLYYDSYLNILKNWRSAAKDMSYLLTVLRMPYCHDFVAFVDAAHNSGWKINLKLSDKARVNFPFKQSFPAMVFTAEQSDLMNINDLVSFWKSDEIKQYFTLPMNGEMAQSLYYSLNDKQIITSETKEYDDGHSVVCNIGTAGIFAFRFAQATTGFVILELHPSYCLGNLNVQFEW